MEYSRTSRRRSRISRGAPMMTTRTKKSSFKREHYTCLVVDDIGSEKSRSDFGKSMGDACISVLEQARDKDRLIQP